MNFHKQLNLILTLLYEDKKTHDNWIRICRQNFKDEFGTLPSEEEIQEIKNAIKGAGYLPPTEEEIESGIKPDGKRMAANQRASNILLNGWYRTGEGVKWVVPKHPTKPRIIKKKGRSVINKIALWGPKPIYEWDDNVIVMAMMPAIRTAMSSPIRLWQNEEEKAELEAIGMEVVAQLISKDECQTPFKSYADQYLRRRMMDYKTEKLIGPKVQREKFCPKCQAQYVSHMVGGKRIWEVPPPQEKDDGSICYHVPPNEATKRKIGKWDADARSLDAPMESPEGEQLSQYDIMPDRRLEREAELKKRRDLTHTVLRELIGGTPFEIEVADRLVNARKKEPKENSYTIFRDLSGGEVTYFCPECKKQAKMILGLGEKKVYVPKPQCDCAVGLEPKWVGDMSKALFAVLPEAGTKDPDDAIVKILDRRDGETRILLNNDERRWVDNESLKPLMFINQETGIQKSLTSKLPSYKKKLIEKAAKYRERLRKAIADSGAKSEEDLPPYIKERLDLLNLTFQTMGIAKHGELPKSPAATETTDKKSLIDNRWHWIPNVFVGKQIHFLDGFNANKMKIITSNTETSIAWKTALPHPVEKFVRYEILQYKGSDVDLTRKEQYRVKYTKEIVLSYEWVPEEDKARLRAITDPEEEAKEKAKIVVVTGARILMLYPGTARPKDPEAKAKWRGWAKEMSKHIVDELEEMGPNAVEIMTDKVKQYAGTVKREIARMREQGDNRSDKEIMIDLGVPSAEEFFKEWPEHLPYHMHPYSEDLFKIIAGINKILLEASGNIEDRLTSILMIG